MNTNKRNLITPLGVVSAYGVEFTDEEGDVCLDPDSETLIRLVQAKEFVEIQRRECFFGGKQVIYLLNLLGISLLELEKKVGLTKVRCSQIKNEGSQAITYPLSHDLSDFLQDEITRQIEYCQVQLQYNKSK